MSHLAHDDGRERQPRGGWWSPTARRLHLTLAIALPCCLAAGWFELTRALNGRAIAWVYAGEWPLSPAFRCARKNSCRPQRNRHPASVGGECERGRSARRRSRAHSLADLSAETAGDRPSGGTAGERLRIGTAPVLRIGTPQCGSSASTATATNSKLK